MKLIISIFLTAAVTCAAVSCSSNKDKTMSNIDRKCVEKTIQALEERYALVEGVGDRLARGVEQVAALWTEADGTPESSRRSAWRTLWPIQTAGPGWPLSWSGTSRACGAASTR